MARVSGDFRIRFSRPARLHNSQFLSFSIATSVLAVCTLIILSGCGKGPKHLSESDYGQGKTAFEALERYSANPSNLFSSDRQLAEQQMKGISNQELLHALEDYHMSILNSVLWAQKAQIDMNNILLAKTEPERQKWQAEQSRAESAVGESENILILCHDDAAAYFDENAAATYSCNARIAKFEAEYPTQ